jgi:hypothetical protein
MPLQDFQTIWDAMADDTGNAVMFQGRIRFTLPGEPAEDIPFVARLADMAGDVLDAVYEQIMDGAPGNVKGVKATIRNAIESNLTIKSIKGQLMRNDVATSGKIDAVRRNSGGAAATLPVTLAPGEAIEIDVSPSSALPGSGQMSASFELNDIVVLPDLTEVLKVIALRDPQSSRKITVSTFREVLAGAGLTEMKVEFKQGNPVSLSSTALEGSTKVRYRVIDTLARNPEADRYSFRVVTPAQTGDWKTGDSDSITIASDGLPR